MYCIGRHTSTILRAPLQPVRWLDAKPPFGGFAYSPVMPIANVYVDGFNLYFGALRNTPYRWLNIVELSRRLLRDEVTLNRVRYFTARVVSRPDDPTAAERQETYLRALPATGSAPSAEAR